MNEKKLPVAKVNVGSVAAAIWRNESQGKPYYNANFELRYQTKEGVWQTGESYGPMELLALAKCADLAFNEIAALRKQDKDADVAIKAA